MSKWDDFVSASKPETLPRKPRGGKLPNLEPVPTDDAGFIKQFGCAPPSADQIEAASDSDRTWFASNPERKYRVRLPMAGEIELSLNATVPVVITTLLAPGVRTRRLVDFFLAPADYVDPDGFIWEVTPGKIEQTEDCVIHVDH